MIKSAKSRLETVSDSFLVEIAPGYDICLTKQEIGVETYNELEVLAIDIEDQLNEVLDLGGLDPMRKVLIGTGYLKSEAKSFDTPVLVRLVLWAACKRAQRVAAQVL